MLYDLLTEPDICNRQGVLPFTEFWVSTKPFGTPLGPYLIIWFTTFIMTVAPPAGDAFQFGTSTYHVSPPPPFLSPPFWDLKILTKRKQS